MRNLQVGPDEATATLVDLVASITYKPGWTVELANLKRGQGSEGLTLVVTFTAPDSTNPEQTTTGVHLFPVLPAAYGREAWEHWVFQRLLLVERHETMEWFKVDGVAPFFPDHGPGRDPYELMRIKPAEQPMEAAEPWHGGVPDDPHFQEQP